MSAAGLTTFAPARRLRGTLRPPPDKSISHRAAILAAMGEGRTRVEGFLDAADTRSTLRAMELLGAGIEAAADQRSLTVTIDGVGLRGPAPARVDVGNAGTLLRLLPGWLAGQSQGSWRLDGDESIRRRPVDRVAEPLREMGGRLEAREGRLPPLEVHGSELRGREHRLAVASAQVKSCLLLAGLLAEGPTKVIEPAPSRDHTERMLRSCGVEVRSERASSLPSRRRAAGAVTVEPVERLRPPGWRVPGDPSSAAFWIAAATIVPGARVELEGVGLNPTRLGLVAILTRMGAGIEVVEDPGSGDGEPNGTIRARHGPRLEATRVGGAEIPLAIDELPLLALVACFADGATVVSDASELRHKESDRIVAVVDGLTALGAQIEAREDGFVVRGGDALRGGRIDAAGDHRLAMMGAVAGLASREGVEVVGFEVAAVSYPGFERDLARLAGR